MKTYEQVKKAVQKIVGKEVDVSAYGCELYLSQDDHSSDSDGDYLSITCNMSEFPNCCGIVVAGELEVLGDLCKDKLPKLLPLFSKVVEICAREEYNAGTVVCTWITKDKPTLKASLKKAGWKDAVKFINPKTKNPLALSYLKL